MFPGITYFSWLIEMDQVALLVHAKTIYSFERNSNEKFLRYRPPEVFVLTESKMAGVGLLLPRKPPDSMENKLRFLNF